MENFEQGDNVRIEITVKERDARVYSLVTPSAGCQISIYDQDNATVVDDVSMTPETTGLYYYNWQSLSTSARGVYTVMITADNGGAVGVVKDKLFKLK